MTFGLRSFKKQKPEIDFLFGRFHVSFNKNEFLISEIEKRSICQILLSYWKPSHSTL